MKNQSDVRAETLSCLSKATSFCSFHSQLCNIHTVDFITGRKWKVLPSPLRKELRKLNWEQLQSLTKVEAPSFLTQRDFPHLFNFVADAKAHTLEALKICSSLSTILPSFSKTSVAKKSPYWCMSPKKSHEVEALASVISPLAAAKGVKVVVDIGSGKGYLSSFLCIEHKLNVLAIDNSRNNTSGAVERNKKVSYYRNRSRRKLHSSLNTVKPNISLCSESLEARHSGSNYVPSSEGFGKTCDAGCTLNSAGTFASWTHHVDSSFDLSYFINDFLLLLNEKNVGAFKNTECASHTDTVPTGNQVLLCSLHGCGNLSASLLKLFISTEEVKIMCSVGCCYHLIEEAFFKSLFCNEGVAGAQEFGFPLSSELLKMKCQLGRNARMLASQSIDRISAKETKCKKNLFYRALLEVILRDTLGDISHVHNVGHIADRDSGFSMYVQKALKQLKLDHVQLLESDIEEYLEKYSKEEKRLYALQQLRIIMAPCIEALILLDRLMFLLEQEIVQEAHLVRVFDPVTSPRCYGLIAWK